jgi:hypothetical protein
MSGNDNNMSIHGVSNNSSSSSLTEEEVFTQIKDLVSQYRIDKEMENDGNDQYHSILSQAIPNLYGGDILSSKNNFSENVIDIFDKLKDKLKSFNEDNEYYESVFDFSQPLANFYLKVIITIDYTDKLIQINLNSIQVEL